MPRHGHPRIVIDVAASVSGLGGMAQKRQLVRLGARDLDLTRAVRAGAVVRARQGWYTTLLTDDPRVRAVRVGGRLTGLSLVAAEGGWVLDTPPLHVSLPSNAARLRSSTDRFEHPGAAGIRDVVLHWESPQIAARGTEVAVSMADALVRVVLDENLETAVAALDWARHTQRIDLVDFERMLLQLPRNRRWIGDWVEPRCESLPESLARTRLRLAGHRVRVQVPVGALERIDLVVDDEIGLETDGEEHHRDRFEADRSKDLEITTAGFHAMRAHARAVFNQWPRVLRAVQVALARRGVDPAFGAGGRGGSTVRHAFGKSGVAPTVLQRLPQGKGRRGRDRTATPEFPKGRGMGGAAGNTDSRRVLHQG